MNNSNFVSLLYTKGFGWMAELNLENLFTQLFKEECSRSYLSYRVVQQKCDKKILDVVKAIIDLQVPKRTGSGSG
ncbi:MAG: hypothetical protein ACFC1C_00965 [Candidatus Malihini olakiniferum]